MSEAITADIPLKPPVVGLKPVPLKAEPPPVPTTAAVPEPPGALTKLFAVFGLALTRRQAAMSASAIASVILGIVGVKLLMPSKDVPPVQPLVTPEPQPTGAPNGIPPIPEVVPPKPAASPLSPPVAAIDNRPVSGGNAQPSEPWLPLPPMDITPRPTALTAPVASGTLFPPPNNLAPASEWPLARPSLPPAITTQERTAPPEPSVFPAGNFTRPVGQSAVPPMTPPAVEPSPVELQFRTGGRMTQPLIPVPTPPLGGLVPASGVLTPNNFPIPLAPLGGTSPMTPPGLSTPPPLPVGGQGSGGTTFPVTPAPAIPSVSETPTPFVPPLLGGPVAPPSTASPLVSPVTTPMPINVGPPLMEPLQTAPLTRPLDPPPAPKLTYPAPVAVTPEVRPLAVSQSAPKTSFDLDIHSVKASDTYDSISREHYNDAKYAIALKQFNGGRALPNSGSIDIPPIHVLRKQYPGSISTSTGRPTNGGSAEWVTPGATAPASPPPTEFRASRSGQYSVPAGGATLKAIARATLGTDQRWNEIWDMNPKLVRADDVIPAGTTLTLPSDARIP